MSVREIMARIIRDETGEADEESGFVADAILAVLDVTPKALHPASPLPIVDVKVREANNEVAFIWRGGGRVQMFGPGEIQALREHFQRESGRPREAAWLERRRPADDPERVPVKQEGTENADSQ